MKQHAVLLYTCLALAVAVSGCAAQEPAPTADNASVTPARTIPTTTTSDSDLAPPYEEIKQTIYDLTRPNGEAPEHGLDGLVDPQIREAFGNYNVSLRDKQVRGWQGWLSAYTWIGGQDNAGYSLSIFMHEPQAGEQEYDGVLMDNVPVEVMQRLKPDVDKRFGVWSKAWPHVVFSGRIEGTFDNGEVLLSYQMIERVP